MRDVWQHFSGPQAEAKTDKQAKDVVKKYHQVFFEPQWLQMQKPAALVILPTFHHQLGISQKPDYSENYFH